MSDAFLPHPTWAFMMRTFAGMASWPKKVKTNYQAPYRCTPGATLSRMVRSSGKFGEVLKLPPVARRNNLRRYHAFRRRAEV